MFLSVGRPGPPSGCLLSAAWHCSRPPAARSKVINKDLKRLYQWSGYICVTSFKHKRGGKSQKKSQKRFQPGAYEHCIVIVQVAHRCSKSTQHSYAPDDLCNLCIYMYNILNVKLNVYMVNNEALNITSNSQHSRVKHPRGGHGKRLSSFSILELRPGSWRQ